MSKNTRNRILLTALAALLLVTLTIGGTMAWLVAEYSTVTNTFTKTDVNVGLEETVNNNFDIVPGGDDTKDPKAWIVDGSEPAYLFVEIVENNNTYTIEGTETQSKYITYGIASGWTKLDSACTANTTVIWREVTTEEIGVKYDILAGNEVEYDTEITKATMPTDNAKPTIAFQAYACQSANVDDAATAWSYIQNGGKTPVVENPAE